MEITKLSGWFKYRMPIQQRMGMVFGVSMKGLTVENVAQVNYCARVNNFTLLYFDFCLLLS